MSGGRTIDEHRVARSLGTRGRPVEGREGAIEQVAASDATVLILGERGVGHKEVARTVHRLSARRNRPYEEVTCTVPVERLDQELFGDSCTSGRCAGGATRFRSSPATTWKSTRDGTAARDGCCRRRRWSA